MNYALPADLVFCSTFHISNPKLYDKIKIVDSYFFVFDTKDLFVFVILNDSAMLNYIIALQLKAISVLKEFKKF